MKECPECQPSHIRKNGKRRGRWEHMVEYIRTNKKDEMIVSSVQQKVL